MNIKREGSFQMFVMKSVLHDCPLLVVHGTSISDEPPITKGWSNNQTTQQQSKGFSTPPRLGS